MLSTPDIDVLLKRAADTVGTPAYVYFTDLIEKRLAELHSAFGSRFALSFAARANPNPALRGWLANRVEFLDVSSIGEWRLGLDAGWKPARASFTGPAK